MNDKISLWHLLWAIPMMILTETLLILRLMRGGKKGDKKDERRR